MWEMHTDCSPGVTLSSICVSFPVSFIENCFSASHQSWKATVINSMEIPLAAAYSSECIHTAATNCPEASAAAKVTVIGQTLESGHVKVQVQTSDRELLSAEDNGSLDCDNHGNRGPLESPQPVDDRGALELANRQCVSHLSPSLNCGATVSRDPLSERCTDLPELPLFTGGCVGLVSTSDACPRSHDHHSKQVQVMQVSQETGLSDVTNTICSGSLEQPHRHLRPRQVMQALLETNLSNVTNAQTGLREHHVVLTLRTSAALQVETGQLHITLTDVSEALSSSSTVADKTKAASSTVTDVMKVKPLAETNVMEAKSSAGCITEMGREKKHKDMIGMPSAALPVRFFQHPTGPTQPSQHPTVLSQPSQDPTVLSQPSQHPKVLSQPSQLSTALSQPSQHPTVASPPSQHLTAPTPLSQHPTAPAQRGGDQDAQVHGSVVKSLVAAPGKRGRPRKHGRQHSAIDKMETQEKNTEETGRAHGHLTGGWPSGRHSMSVGKSRYNLRGKKLPASIFGLYDSEEEKDQTEDGLPSEDPATEASCASLGVSHTVLSAATTICGNVAVSHDHAVLSDVAVSHDHDAPAALSAQLPVYQEQCGRNVYTCVEQHSSMTSTNVPTTPDAFCGTAASIVTSITATTTSTVTAVAATTTTLLAPQVSRAKKKMQLCDFEGHGSSVSSLSPPLPPPAKAKKRSRIKKIKLEAGGYPTFARRKRNNQKLAACKYCERKFCDYTGVVMHARKFHVDKEGLTQYLNSLKKLQVVKCSVCGVECDDRFRLQQHEDKEHFKSGSFPCVHCGKTWPNMLCLKSHIRTVHLVQGKAHACQQCPARFKWAATLKQHIEEIHKGVKAVSCDVCGKHFYRQSQLNRHRVIHGPEESKLACSLCGKRFGYLNNLQRHMSIVHHYHPLEELFHCSYCGKGFSRKAPLTCHVEKVHFSLFPYNCPVCKRGFSRAVMLEKHMADEHNNMDFKALEGRRPHFKYNRGKDDVLCCSFCGGTFYYKAQLVEHIHCTHGDTFPFQCSACGQGFLEHQFAEVHHKQAHGMSSSPASGADARVSALGLGGMGVLEEREERLVSGDMSVQVGSGAIKMPVESATCVASSYHSPIEGRPFDVVSNASGADFEGAVESSVVVGDQGCPPTSYIIKVEDGENTVQYVIHTSAGWAEGRDVGEKCVTFLEDSSSSVSVVRDIASLLVASTADTTYKTGD